MLRQVIEQRPQAEQFIGPNRSKDVLPGTFSLFLCPFPAFELSSESIGSAVRELTFRALLPHAPADWKVVILGQNPYPRIESATGIAMFDGKVSGQQNDVAGLVAKHGFSS